MSLVHLCMPSKRPAAEVNRVMAKWFERGYQINLQRDPGESEGLTLLMQSVIERPYAGYPEAVNLLAKRSLQMDSECQWIVTGGDDTSPDPNKSADEIGAQLTEHFGGTFGICQATGHRWGADEQWAKQMFPGREAYIDRICGSPFLGREWCLRGNQGAGPLYPGFWHMHADECLQEVAEKLGILWQRRDLTHFHDHWALDGFGKKAPDFLRRANSPEHWKESKELLDRLRATGFKECLPL